MSDLAPLPAPASVMTGLWGEFLAREKLRDLGYDVTWLGNTVKHYDLLAAQPGRATLEVSVKATTRHDGGIAWRKPGVEVVAPWAAASAERGRVGLFVLVWLSGEPYQVHYAEGEDALLLPRPEVLAVTGMTVEDWGRTVDHSRTQYGRKTRQHGDNKGERLSEDGLLYPVYVEDHGEPLAKLLDDLPVPR